MKLKNWANKQLTDYKLIDRVDESKLRESYTSKTHDCDLTIIGIYWTSFEGQKNLYITAVGDYNGEMQRFKLQVMNPILPRVKDISELLNAKIFAMCHYCQFSAVAGQRKILTCYCKIEKTDGKKFNLSTAPIGKDLGTMIEELPNKKIARVKDYKKFASLPIRNIVSL